jgi:hypothetical protein
MISNCIRNGFVSEINKLIDDELLCCMRKSYNLTDDKERSIVAERLSERLINFIDDKYSVTEDQDF